jgi:hypothetical protein
VITATAFYDVALLLRLNCNGRYFMINCLLTVFPFYIYDKVGYVISFHIGIIVHYNLHICKCNKICESIQVDALNE